MEIDWFTVVAQLVNFLILVWLLKRFLYKPVLNAIDEREKKIATQLQDAESKKEEARMERQQYRQKNEAFDHEHAAKLEEARQRVESEKQKRYDEARQESSDLRLKLEESLRQQQHELQDSLKRRAKEAVFDIARKALSDLANAELETQVVNVFIEKIQQLNPSENAKLIKALETKGEAVHIKSVFQMDEQTRGRIEQTVNEITGQQSRFEYEIQPELLTGIRLETPNFQLSWSIESYLETLKMESL